MKRHGVLRVCVLMGLVATTLIGVQMNGMSSGTQSGTVLDRLVAARLLTGCRDTRADAVHRAQAVDTVSSVLEDANAALWSAYAAGTGISATYGDGFSEVYADVLGCALRLARGSVGVQRQRLLAALVQGSYNPDSALARELATYGDAVVQHVLLLVRSRLEPQRWSAYGVLAGLVEHHTGAEGAGAVSIANRRRAIDALIGGLKENSYPSVLLAVRGLEMSGAGEALPALHDLDRQLASGQPQDRRAERLRPEVARAMAKIKAVAGK